MQFTKDSFYITLRNRLATVSPARVITIDGTTRPAIVAAENELVVPIKPLPDAFYLEWGNAQVVPQQSGDHAIFSLECVVSYHTFGSVQSGVDRGRSLASLDTDLLTITQPGSAPKCDYTQTPPVSLGSNIVWSTPQFGKIVGSEASRNEALPRGTTGVRLERSATVKVFFFPEVNF